mmetsp:Transcript_11518/g.24388  ORF Transcript_11518/g.24388 Transcript_11518/m.24388 type:complete len:121 (+) Transcript_11518:267-629(+)
MLKNTPFPDFADAEKGPIPNDEAEIVITHIGTGSHDGDIDNGIVPTGIFGDYVQDSLFLQATVHVVSGFFGGEFRRFDFFIVDRDEEVSVGEAGIFDEAFEVVDDEGRFIRAAFVEEFVT